MLNRRIKWLLGDTPCDSVNDSYMLLMLILMMTEDDGDERGFRDK